MLNNQIVFALVCFVLGGIATVGLIELWSSWEHKKWRSKEKRAIKAMREYYEGQKHVADTGVPDEKPFIPPQRDAEAEIPPDYQAEDDFKYPEGEEPEDLEEKKKKEGTRGFFS